MLKTLDIVVSHWRGK